MVGAFFYRIVGNLEVVPHSRQRPLFQVRSIEFFLSLPRPNLLQVGLALRDRNALALLQHLEGAVVEVILMLLDLLGEALNEFVIESDGFIEGDFHFAQFEGQLDEFDEGGCLWWFEIVPAVEEDGVKDFQFVG